MGDAVRLLCVGRWSCAGNGAYAERLTLLLWNRIQTNKIISEKWMKIRYGYIVLPIVLVELLAVSRVRLIEKFMYHICICCMKRNKEVEEWKPLLKKSEMHRDLPPGG